MFFFFLCLLRQMEMQKECGVAEHNVHATPCGLCSWHYRAMSKLSKLICRILTTEGKAKKNQCESLACACQLAKFCALECSLCRFFGLMCSCLPCGASRLARGTHTGWGSMTQASSACCMSGGNCFFLSLWLVMGNFVLHRLVACISDRVSRHFLLLQAPLMRMFENIFF